jgi:hypothetical protein
VLRQHVDAIRGKRKPTAKAVQKWRPALKVAGICFIDADDVDGPGVRFRGAKAKR